MGYSATRVPYRQTQAFSDLVLDYLDQHEEPFSAIQAVMEARTNFLTDRSLLVRQLTLQYGAVAMTGVVEQHIRLLEKDHCFTVTTAHQNNLFSGPLYVVYKILHAIALSRQLKKQFPAKEFVPVFYMGTEDADLAELDHVFLGTDKMQWDTSQRGAVGRMQVDKALVALIDRIQGQLGVLPFGEEWVRLLRESYTPGSSIAASTFKLLHALFGAYGLIILLPDQPALKKTMIPVFRKELFEQFSAPLVNTALQQLSDQGYPVQVHPRPINLFYLEQGIRERIERQGDHWVVTGTSLSFNKEQLEEELVLHPERFSPNVILRGLYQCTLLPDVAFIGGGAEIAYWTPLQTLFKAVGVPFPLLVLRNSYLLTDADNRKRVASLGLVPADLFANDDTLLKKIIDRAQLAQTDLQQEKEGLRERYQQLAAMASGLDPTLKAHVLSLEAKMLKGIEGLEKKMWRSLKRGHLEQQQQLQKIRSHWFPATQLQERHQHIGYFYARWGKELIDALLEHAPALEQEFTILDLP